MIGRLRWFAIALAFAVAGVLLAVVLGQQQTLGDRLDNARDRSDARADEIAGLRDIVTEQNRRLRAAGKKPVEAAEEIEDEPTSPLQGPRGPGCVEELSLAQCRGPAGVAGKDGRSIPGEDGRDGVDGSDGANGSDGAPGADSTVPGPQGPPGRDGVDGKDSTVPGPQGPAGPPGASAYPFTFTFTVTDESGHERTYTVTCAESGCTTA